MITSEKGQLLLAMYASMAREGYQTTDHQTVTSAFNDMEISAYRQPVQKLFQDFEIKTLLDYGCGGSDYERPGFDGEQSAREYFGLEQVYRYEPARELDERRQSEALVCFDVMEHIFIADVPGLVRELFSLAGRLLVVNVACYSARAMLPNGENAHITVRPPHWWKGLFDSIALEYPTVTTCLMCSTAWRKTSQFELWSANDWLNEPGFVTTK